MVIGQDHWLGFLTSQGCRLCSAIDKALGRTPPLSRVAVWAPWLGVVVGWALRMPTVTVQAPWLCKARGCAQQLAGLLAWLPAQAGLLDGLHGRLDSLARLPGGGGGAARRLCSAVGWGWESASLPRPAGRKSSKACNASCLGTQIKQSC